MIYQKDSSKAEEFIHHEEILDTLEYAQNNKDNRVLIEQLIEKAASIARVMGAIFIKLGRAPATIVIFILFLSYSV